MQYKIETTLPHFFPAEIWLQLFSHMIPEHLAAFALVNSYLKDLVRSNAIWKNKTQTHFPDDYRDYINKPDTNWYTAFSACYTINYQGNPSYIFKDSYALHQMSIKKMFSQVKEGLSVSPLHPQHLDIKDSRKTTLLEWVRKSRQQKMLNHFYRNIKNYYAQSGTPISSVLDYKERSLLHWSVLCNQSNKVIRSLYEADFFLTAATSDDEEIIHYACAIGRIKLIQFLLNTYPALLNKKNHYGQTPLFFAVRGGSLETVQLLVNSGAELYMYEGTMLHVACGEGHLEIAQFLLQQDPGLLNCRNNLGQTAVWIAANGGHADILVFLADKGADVCVSASGNFYAALHLAIQKNDVNMVELLLKHNANPSTMAVVDDTHVSAIGMACRVGNIKIVQLLLKKQPVLLHEGSKFRDTPLITAVYYGHVDIVQYLIEQGADLTKTYYQDYSDYTALHWAAYQNQVETVKVLLNTEIPLSTYTTSWGKTADQLTNNPLIKNLIRLDNHIRHWEGKAIKKKSAYVGFFSKTQAAPMDIDTVLDAALVLKAVLSGHAQPGMLERYQEELNTFDLRIIFNEVLPYLPGDDAILINGTNAKNTYPPIPHPNA